MLRLKWIVLAAMLWLPTVQAEQPVPDGLPVIAASELPPEARDTLRAIKQGGPFAYPQDGKVFKNYERVLPKRPHGYYHEYTVSTPGARNRAARRIVCGSLAECYYTADHYQSFRKIQE